MDEVTINHKDKRHVSRMLAIQYIFTSELATRMGIGLGPYEPQAILSYLEEDSYDKNLYTSIVDGVIEKLSDIDSIIESHAPAWPIDQINIVDLSILRCSIWEGLFYKKTPPKVIINEAIELGKELSADKSGSFINGVLGKIIQI